MQHINLTPVGNNSEFILRGVDTKKFKAPIKNDVLVSLCTHVTVVNYLLINERPV